ncbi:TIGR03668 family PPOX class F420-dependent oxidoreductase [Actinomadura sp. HBU206391]|uniref:TIGR03668 family PPOX class F420-dependent oxidoreductase n=1 Tax=Actinomadura sp. HBU206391 TaxID=2731692 RepID=UPI00164F2B29|nr:TIGR03668 family PPOX class F420-dependent oxidoreductase [Actinomadura sp. HBU206391]MBC6461861.1 TIGR03668 family PPOX class F420-dependent oxidoreductase [Actinomadura sp. HBU206391]
MPGLPEDVARARFASVPVVRLATVGDDGRPHIVPTTFAVDGDRVYAAVDHKPKRTGDLKRLRNIEGEPRVALLADHYGGDWERLWWVRADGIARVVGDPDEAARPIDLLVRRYRQYEGHRPEGPVISVLVERWSGWAWSPPDA